MRGITDDYSWCGHKCPKDDEKTRRDMSGAVQEQKLQKSKKMTYDQVREQVEEKRPQNKSKVIRK